METGYIRAAEMAERLNCSVSLAYSIVKELNKELKKKGYITISGRVPRAYFEERCYLAGAKK